MIDEARSEAPARREPLLEEQAALAVVRAGEKLMAEPSRLIKKRGVSPLHYNILRILRGAGGEGLACSTIAERLIARAPDVTRLIDRLEAKGLAERRRPGDDRRVVLVSITPEGLALLAGLDEPIAEAHRSALAHMGRNELRTLHRLLLKAAEGS